MYEDVFVDENPYYDVTSLEVVKMVNDKIELDNSVLTDFTLVIECNNVDKDKDNDMYKRMINQICRDIGSICISFKSYEFREYTIYLGEYNMITNDYKKKNIKLFDDRIEISLDLFNYNVHKKFKAAYKVFPLYLFKNIYGTIEPLILSTYNKFTESLILSTYNNFIESLKKHSCYFKYNKYKINCDLITDSSIIYHKKLDSKIFDMDNFSCNFSDNFSDDLYIVINNAMKDVGDFIFIFGIYSTHDDTIYDIYNIKEIKLIYDDDEIYIYDNIENSIKYKIINNYKYICINIKKHVWKNNVKIFISSNYEMDFFTSYFPVTYCVDVNNLLECQ